MDTLLALDLRDPISTLTHGIGLIASVPATLLLLARAPRDRVAWVSLLVFGLSLAACYGFSARYHAEHGDPERVAALRRLDHVGIHFLIAGTYTGVVGVLFRGRMRSTTLALAWIVASGGAAWILIYGVLPTWLGTLFYLGMGWGGIFLYSEIARSRSHRFVRPLLGGGMLYSVGAVANVVRWPVLWEGLVGPHEVFHVFVLAGSAAHVRFVLLCIAAVADLPADSTRGRVDAGQPRGVLRGPRTIGQRRAGEVAESSR